MATRFFLQRTNTWPPAIPEAGGYKDMSTTVGTITTGANAGIDATVRADNSRQIAGAGIFYSERLTAQTTISGSITFSMYPNQWTPTNPLRIRLALSKITAGGGMVETPIMAWDSPADIINNQANTWSATPSTAITLAPGERFVLRVYAFPPGGVWGTGTVFFTYDGKSSGFPGYDYLEFTETFTTQLNGTKLYLRRTSTIAIGGFMDLLSVKGTSTFTTAVVNTSAGGTQIQWTKTAGGALAEWISPRFKAGWPIPDSTYISRALFSGVLESNASANAGFRCRLVRRKPDTTEVEFAVLEYNLELGTTAVIVDTNTANITWTSFPGTTFQEDDRMVLRCYVIAKGGTMGGGFTATLQYDHNGSDTGGSVAWVQFLDTSDFKAETDPARSFVIPSGTSTLGLGNGQ